MKKKILVISPTPTHPQNAGNRIRIYTLLKSLQKNGFEIHLICEDRELWSDHVYSEKDIRGMLKSWDYFIYVCDSSFSLYTIINNMLLKDSKYKINIHTSQTRSINIFFSFLIKMDYIISSFLKTSGIYINFFTKNISLFLQKHFPKIHKYIRIIRHKDLICKKTPKIAKINCLSPRTEKYIQILKNKFTYDYVLVEYIYTSKALNLFNNKVIKIIDTHDVFSKRNKKYAKLGIKENYYMSSSVAEEEKALKRADIVIAIQDQEKKYFQKHTNARVEVIGHKVKLIKQANKKTLKNRILFVGCINKSNIHGITHFITNIFPKIIKKVPDAKIILVGGICKTIKNSPNIIKLDEIRDLKNIYEEVKVVINPVIVGTGLKIKCIEAIGFSKPLVATKHALEGLYNQKFFNSKKPAFLIANNDKKFAEHIIKLLSDNNYNNYISCNAYKYAVQYNQQIDNQIKKVFQ